MMNKKLAFTLAEVLITLGIIGIVAEMTIPTLVASYQNQEYVTGLKKAYTEWNQVLIQFAADNGCVGDLPCTGFFAPTVTREAFGTEIAKYFKIAKNCEASDSGPTITGCMTREAYLYYNRSGAKSAIFDDTTSYRFITTDGMSFGFWNSLNNCTFSGKSQNVTGNMTVICGKVDIDVNGLSGPNVLGRDIFSFWITNGKGPLLYPGGGIDDNWWGQWRKTDGTIQHCNPTDPNGSFCAGRVVEEGWRMTY